MKQLPPSRSVSIEPLRSQIKTSGSLPMETPAATNKSSETYPKLPTLVQKCDLCARPNEIAGKHRNGASICKVCVQNYFPGSCIDLTQMMLIKRVLSPPE